MAKFDDRSVAENETLDNDAVGGIAWDISPFYFHHFDQMHLSAEIDGNVYQTSGFEIDYHNEQYLPGVNLVSHISTKCHTLENLITH